MSAEELIEALAARLKARDGERKRETMPAIGLIADDGTEIVVTLAAHLRDGVIE